MCIRDRDLIVLDGIEGTVMINPDETTVKEYETKRAEFIAYKELQPFQQKSYQSPPPHKV